MVSAFLSNWFCILKSVYDQQLIWAGIKLNILQRLNYAAFAYQIYHIWYATIYQPNLFFQENQIPWWNVNCLEKSYSFLNTSFPLNSLISVSYYTDCYFAHNRYQMNQSWNYLSLEIFRNVESFCRLVLWDLSSKKVTRLEIPLPKSLKNHGW